MQRLIESINSMPEFMWNNIFTVINTLICGLIVALFTSTFLKKKEERTRIAGVIVEKRINSEQEILHFLERELFKEEINVDNSNKGIHEDRMSDEEFEEFLKSSMPREYEQMKQERDAFEEMLKKTADECGVKIVHRSELDQYPDMYGMSLKEIFDEIKEKNHEKRTG